MSESVDKCSRCGETMCEECRLCHDCASDEDLAAVGLFRLPDGRVTSEAAERRIQELDA